MAASSQKGNKAPDQALAGLAEVQAIARRGPAPVHLWNPPFCGDIDMRIAADGTWFYGGTPVGRPALVQLFSSILRKDPDRYVLVTPVERVGVTVDDAPFLAVEMLADGDRLGFRTQVDDVVWVDAEHPLRFETGAAEGVKPYVKVRGELWALVKRALFYDLVERGEVARHDGEDWFGVRSAGLFFPMRRAAEVEGFERLLARLPLDAMIPTTPDALRALARAKLHADPPTEGGWSDFVLNGGLPADLPAPRDAAVLAPIVARPDGLTVLLTLRASTLRAHSGQVAFPGGKIDPGETALETALREAQEEIGLAARFVEPLGWLDAYRTGTGFRIAPLVALIDPAFMLALNREEVEAAFETPLAFLMDEANHQIHEREWNGKPRRFYAMPHQDRYIWGATAGMLRNLWERLSR